MNYDKAAFMTAGHLGCKAQVSESTVVRFASQLGYDGYPNMQRALQELVRGRLTSLQRIQVSRGSRPLNGDIYLMSPLSFSRSSISVPLTFFRSTLSISLSLKDSGAWLMGFLSMA